LGILLQNGRTVHKEFQPAHPEFAWLVGIQAEGIRIIRLGGIIVL
jgi:hypothetical protein